LPEEEPSEENTEEEEMEEVFSEEKSMNQVDTSEEKLYARCAHDILFSNDSDTPLVSSEPPPTLKSHSAPTRRAATMTMMTSGCR
jgi:hypothetical protein